MRIVITGAKSSGKSTVAAKMAETLRLSFVETDGIIEKHYARQHGRELSFYEICEELGEPEFREYERHAVKQCAEMDYCVISAGGLTLLDPESRALLRKNSIILLLQAQPDILWQRMEQIGKSKYLQLPREHFRDHVEKVMEVIYPFADVVVDASGSGDQTARQAIESLGEYIAVLSSSPNTLGQVIRLTTFGESHGPAVGAVLDGLAPGIDISVDEIQTELDRRRPGQSKVATSRREPDKVKILSGLFEGKTTGTPIAMVIENKDQDSTKYDIIRDLFRPGHADFTFYKKYGLRDHKGGGRSSGRETAARVAGGAVAKKLLKDRGVEITAYSLEIAGIGAKSFDLSCIEQNPVRCPDPEAAGKMQQAILDARNRGDSVGGVVELIVKNVPAGLGDPVFGKLDARLAAGFFSLGAVKGLEFGDGFKAAVANASEFNDQMADGKLLTNHAGGILGGISTGGEITARLAVKPTPSIAKSQQTSDLKGQTHKIEIEGRHDPCIVPRIIPVVEAMAALVILDAWEIQNRLRPGWFEA